MDFHLVEDGSVQALVRLSAENMDKFIGTAFQIDFNPDYIQPSYLTSEGGKERQHLIPDKSEDRSYYTEDPSLETNAGSPFSETISSHLGDLITWQVSYVEQGTPSSMGTLENGLLDMYLVLDKNKAGGIGLDHPVVKMMDPVGDPVDFPQDAEHLYIDASGTVDMDTGYDGYESDGTGGPGKGINLGTLSFRVNPDNLEDMVKNFAGSTNGMSQDGSEFLFGYADQSKQIWNLWDLKTPDDYEYLENYYSPDKLGGLYPPYENAQVIFEFIFPKVLAKAEIAGGDELTVNAYQAYTAGDMTDIASTLQRYRPEVTATYADATKENFVFNWGDTADGYKVYVPAAEGTTPDYTRSDGSKWVTLNSVDYSPKGGTYLATQYFNYVEDGVRKTYPLPMEVLLTVTQVNLVDINAVDLEMTYKASDAAAFETSSLKALDLPNKAVLSLSPVPSALTLTMPITIWTPGAIKDLIQANGQVQDWPAVGNYTLEGPQKTDIVDYVNVHYPWVTTDDFNRGISAHRTIVDDADYNFRQYKATYVDASVDGTLSLRVTKVGAGGPEAIADGAVFRTYLPGATLIKDDATDGLPLTSSASDWNTALVNGDPAYSPVNTKDATNGCVLQYYPGNKDHTTPHREDVRRAINLGGWFYVSVSEDGGAAWSELIPVYVPPRENRYIESKIFDFTGNDADLYPFYATSSLPTHVVLPVGYTVPTLYDGMTGAEPGVLGEFEVDAWNNIKADPSTQVAPDWSAGDVVTYGSDDYANTVYSGFGRVANAADGSGAKKTATVKLQPRFNPSPDPDVPDVPVPEPGDESILLTHEGSDHTGITWTGTTPDEVAEVTYTVRSVNYVERQVFTLTIENNGTEPIYGMSVETGTGPHTPADDNLAPHFEILRQPAPYLAPGGKTTFDITYVDDLPATEDGSIFYEDVIRIISNRTTPAAPLKTFVANFEVTSLDVYTVTVVTDPADGSMGSAKIVGGLSGYELPAGVTAGSEVTETGIANRPSLSPAASDYAVGHKYVWICAEPDDENQVEEVYYTDINGNDPVPLYIYKYTKDADSPTDTDTTVYFFEMPPMDTVVHVKFYEPITAKLRLSALMGYAGTEDEVDALSTGGSLIDEPHQHNIRWYEDSLNIVNRPEMTKEDSSQDTYLMVLGDYIPVAEGTNVSNRDTTGDTLDKTQLQIKLRKNTFPPNIDDVRVEIRDTSPGANPEYLYSTEYGDQPGYTWGGTPDPNASAPSQHQTVIFDSPKSATGEVATKTITITLTCTVEEATPDYPSASPTNPQEVSRSFDVVIVRRGKGPTSDLGYGNSPKGMIYNDSKLTTSAIKEIAWQRFLGDNSTRNSFEADTTPVAASDLSNTYWPEAWGNGTNYDRDEYALFVILGQSFQDPGLKNVKNTAGLPVDVSTISRSMEVELLDTAATTQIGRFAGAHTDGTNVDKITLELGTADTGLVSSSQGGGTKEEISNWWQTTDPETLVTTTYAIRPGIYEMVYTFTDYDGEQELTITRPVVILAPVGDVDANLTTEKADAALIRDRILDPLGGDRSAESVYTTWRLFRYRCCDVNNDRNVNNIDANKIYYGSDEIVPYYKPTDYLS